MFSYKSPIPDVASLPSNQKQIDEPVRHESGHKTAQHNFRIT